jgi:DNA-binding XRE family transcriptional regulator
MALQSRSRLRLAQETWIQSQKRFEAVAMDERVRKRFDPGILSSALENGFSSHGKAIRHLREVAGLTQEQVSDASGVHSTEISRLEGGQGNPTYSTIESLAAGLGVSVSRIFSLGEAYAEGNVR